MKKILIICSNYYDKISKNLIIGTSNFLEENNVDYEVIYVDGCLEIPFILNKLKKKYAGFVLLGCIIKGETDHYSVVKNITLKHIYDSAYNNNLPLGTAILTVENFSQAEVRSDPKKKNLGANAAKACLNLIKLINDKTKNK